MNCPSCQTKLPEGAKFCGECGSNIESSKCKKCDKALKSDARFCHNCGETVTTSTAQALAAGQTPEGKQSWLNSFGTFLFIPVFAGIIVLLFWVNKEPEPLGASSDAGQEQSAPDMAAMEQVHERLELLEQNLEANPKDVDSMDNLAVMYTIAGSYEKTLTYYEMHLEIEPDNKDLKIAMGSTYHNLERTDEAIAIIQEVLDDDPQAVVAMDNLAIIYTKEENFDKALTYYEMHRAIDPDNKDLKIALGLTYNNLKRSEDAVSIIQEVLVEEPTNAFALHYLAEIQSSLHNHEEAEKLWQKIIVAYPGTEMAEVAQQRIHETMHEGESN